MNFLTLIRIERKKIKHSKIFFILLAAAIILWIPSILNVHLNFEMQAEGISPEHNFFIQGFLGLSWFMFPASIIIGTVLISQTERTDNAILKMLALPVHTAGLCLAKFATLLILAAAQVFIMTGMYYASAALCSAMHHYNFILPPLFAAKEAALLFLSAIPMAAFFWMLSVCIKSPLFSICIGLASIVPSVLVINTDAWFAYPMSYPFFLITSEYSRLAANLETAQAELFPWIPAAVAITFICLLISCMRFGQVERRA